MINSELASKALADIKDRPDGWSQGHWAVQTDCGTAYCYAGRAVELSGIPIQIDELGPYIRPEDVPAGVEAISWPFRENRITVRSVAVSVLGISEEQADRLFDSDNEFADLERMVNELITDAYSDEINGFLGEGETELEEGLGGLPADEPDLNDYPDEEGAESSEEPDLEGAPF